jgi:carbamoyl-phosphate synthase small subunit
MSGYQEILTDPSYAYQMLTFTYPHIGNVGVNDDDVESGKPHATGVIIRDPANHYSNYRAKYSLAEYLARNGIVGIAEIDTRALVLKLRSEGSQLGIIATGDAARSPATLVDKLRSLPSMEGLDLVRSLSCKEGYRWAEGTWRLTPDGGAYKTYSEHELKTRPHVVAYDFGIKRNILRLLVETGFQVSVVPADTTASEVLAKRPDGVFLSNGPGDPAAVTYGISAVRELAGKVPMFGICLGHQILGLALGAPTYKLKFGHRGGNHPVRNELTGKVEITVQNHGFATDREKVPNGLTVSHINLNDNTVEGFVSPEALAFSVQYHPECSPGPHDAQYLFKDFYDLVTTKKLDVK